MEKKRSIKRTIIISVLLLILFLIIDYFCVKYSSGLVFNILFYKPFDYAFSLFMFVLYSIINIGMFTKTKNKINRCLKLSAYSLLLAITWTFLAYFIVVQFHTLIGGGL